MITTSFAVTVLSALTATPFALAIGLFTTQYARNGAKFLQPVIELLVGIPSVVYGYVGLTVVVPFIRKFEGSSSALSSGFPGTWRNKMADDLQGHSACQCTGNFHSSHLRDGQGVW